MTSASWTQQQILGQLDSGSRWTGSTVTYAFPATSSGLYGSEEAAGFQGLNSVQQTVAQLALQTWDDLIVADLQKTALVSSNIEFGTTTTGIDFAHAYYPTAGSVWFCRDYSDLMSPEVGEASFLTYIHEIGHAFGLNHMGAYDGEGTWTPSSYQDSCVYSVMSYFGPNWGSGQSSGEGLVAWADWVGEDGNLYSPQTPMLSDIMAMQSIYGAETTTRAGDSTYGFGSSDFASLSAVYNFTINRHPIITIYDAAGNDTLNLSGWSSSSIIDLNPGTYSSCNSMTYNLSIADTCDIENAIGGSGADSISGNALNNHLDGGSGNDLLSGGNGDDVLLGGVGDDNIDGGAGTDTVSYSSLRSNYTIVSISGGFEIASVDDGIDTVKAVEFAQFSDQTVSLVSNTAPTVTAFSPADEASSVAIGSSIALTFSEAIARGTGNIVIRDAAGTLVASYDAATSANLTITGSTLTINPTADLSYGTGYKVELAAGSVKDLAGNGYAGTTSYNFTTQSGAVTPPVTSKLDDFVVLQRSSPSVVGADAGNDTYLISGSMIAAGQNLTISDAKGSNSTQLASGLAIASSKVASNMLKLTLSNGSVVSINGADAFTYDVGGNSTAGIDHVDVSFAAFALNTLGVAVPDSGLATGGALVIGQGGGSLARVEGIPVQVDLIGSETVINVGQNVNDDPVILTLVGIASPGTVSADVI